MSFGHFAVVIQGNVPWLRHGHASTPIAREFDIVSISRRFGHASPTATLAVYSRPLHDAGASAAAAIDGVLGAI
jgi:hypothetical protein